MSLASPSSQRPLKVFLCYSSGDKAKVRELYRRLNEDGFQPWMDEKELIPGHEFRSRIEDTVRTSDAVVVCISAESVAKESFVNREIRIALDVAEEKPEGTIFVIPARLEAVEIPRSLRKFEWADLFAEGGYERLVEALKVRASTIGKTAPSRVTSRPGESGITLETGQSGIGARPEAKPEGLWEWMRARMGLTLIAIGLIVVLLAGTTYWLYQVRKQYRAEATRFNAEGMEKLRVLDTTKAETLLVQAVAADPGNAVMRANLAVAYGERGNYKAAQAEAQKAFEKKSSLSERDALWVDGVKNEMNWKLQLAAVSYGIGWGRHRDTEAGLRLVRVQSLSGKGSSALDTLGDLETNTASSSDPRIAYEKALAADAEKDFAEEVKTLDKIMEEHPKEKEPLIAAAALSQKCWALYMMDRSEQARKACEEAASIFAKQADRLGLARSYARQAVIRMSDEDHDPQAKKLLDDALDIVQPLGSAIDEAGARQNRANWFINQDDSESAQIDYNAAAKIYEQIGSTEGLAALKNNWGTGLLDSCKYAQAKERFESASNDYEKTNNDIGKATVTYNIGLVQLLLGDLKGAGENLKEALRKADKLNMKLEKPSWRTTLGALYMTQGSVPWAEACLKGQDCYLDASTWIKADGTPELSVEAYSDLGLLLISREHAGEAERAARKRIQEIRQEKKPDPDEEAQERDVLARALLEQGSSKQLNEVKDTMAEAQTLKVRDCRTKASLAITAARVSAHLKQFDLARDQLKNAAGQAQEDKLRGYQFEAALAEAEIDFLAGQFEAAEGQAAKVSGEAGAAGYILIKTKADQLIVKIKSKQGHKGS
jgi:Tfp pilus assembly protein PilF